MKPDVKKAFDLVTRVTGAFQGTRAQHFEIQQALKTLEQALTLVAKKEEKKRGLTNAE